MNSANRPEQSGPPELYYDEREARKYTSNSRIRKVQYELAQRAYELLELPDSGEPALLLDIGCGSGLSGEVLSEEGHEWLGVDISVHMLKVARDDNETGGHLAQCDMGAGLPFRPAVFDGAISISAIQWLCHSNASNQDPRRRLTHFFQSLYACLSRSARAVFQFYPESQAQSDLISAAALKAGFQGGLVVDHPDSQRQRKVFLVLSAGRAAALSSAHLKTTVAAKADEMEGKQHIQMVGRERPWKERTLGVNRSAIRIGKKQQQKMARRNRKKADRRKKRGEEADEEEGMDL